MGQSVDEIMSFEGFSGIEMLIYLKKTTTVPQTSRDGHICHIYDLVILTPLKNAPPSKMEGFSLTLLVAVSRRNVWVISFK